MLYSDNMKAAEKIYVAIPDRKHPTRRKLLLHLKRII